MWHTNGILFRDTHTHTKNIVYLFAAKELEPEDTTICERSQTQKESTEYSLFYVKREKKSPSESMIVISRYLEGSVE